jgi:hypothetical protein
MLTNSKIAFSVALVLATASAAAAKHAVHHQTAIERQPHAGTVPGRRFNAL